MNDSSYLHSVVIISEQEFLAFKQRKNNYSRFCTIRVDNKQLELYFDENGRDGVEYPTKEVGRIDILALDEDKNFVVFELKLARGPDRALGQLQRYMGWVKMNLAENREVKGIIGRI